MNINKLVKGLNVDEETIALIKKIVSIWENKKVNELTKLEAARLVDVVLEKLFRPQYNVNYFIPSDFLSTKLGQILFEVKFAYQYYYSSFDLELLSGLTKSTIYYHIKKTNKINIITHGNSYCFSETEIKKFLVPQYMTSEELEKKLIAFWKVKKELKDSNNKALFTDKFNEILNY